MTPRLAAICRHPIKSIGFEPLDRATLTPERGLPMDRHWAVAHAGARFDGDPAGWVPKSNFVRGVAGPALMAVRARLADDGNQLTLSHPDRPDLVVAPETPAGSQRLIDWLEPLWPTTRPPAARIVRTRSGDALSDADAPFVAVLNLASLRALERALAVTLSVHRFRGNLWLDDCPPWAERDWIGRELCIGATRLRIAEPIGRCEATSANPETGSRDLDMLEALRASCGDTDFGVYARVITGGAIAVGDPVAL